jgi:hypothetical protein
MNNQKTTTMIGIVDVETGLEATVLATNLML